MQKCFIRTHTPTDVSPDCSSIKRTCVAGCVHVSVLWVATSAGALFRRWKLPAHTIDSDFVVWEQLFTSLCVAALSVGACARRRHSDGHAAWLCVCATGIGEDVHSRAVQGLCAFLWRIFVGWRLRGSWPVQSTLRTGWGRRGPIKLPRLRVLAHALLPEPACMQWTQGLGLRNELHTRA